VNAPTSPFTKRTLAACLIAGVVETIVVVSAMEPVVLLFVLGPLLFLAVIAWRRRTHIDRSRRIAATAVGVAAFGIASFAVAVILQPDPPQPDRPPLAPLLVPVVQWFAVLYVWLALSKAEAREKAGNPPPSA
jgi:hypothetical protein